MLPWNMMMEESLPCVRGCLKLSVIKTNQITPMQAQNNFWAFFSLDFYHNLFNYRVWLDEAYKSRKIFLLWIWTLLFLLRANHSFKLWKIFSHRHLNSFLLQSGQRMSWKGFCFLMRSPHTGFFHVLFAKNEVRKLAH